MSNLGDNPPSNLGDDLFKNLYNVVHGDNEREINYQHF